MAFRQSGIESVLSLLTGSGVPKRSDGINIRPEALYMESSENLFFIGKIIKLLGVKIGILDFRNLLVE